jgi:hypothetical protein
MIPAMRRFLPVAVGGVAVFFAFASCGTVTQAPDGSGQAGSSAGTSGQAGSSAGTSGQAGSGQAGATAGTTGNGGQAGGVAGTTGGAGTTGSAGTTGNGGRGGGSAGTTASGGRGGQAGGNAGSTGSGGRGGAGGTGRGGAGGQNSDGGVSCSELETEYSKAVADARTCNPEVSGQCQQKVNSGLSCPGCQIAVNSTTRPDAIRMQWTKQGCTPGIVCPAIICVAPGAGICTKTDASSSGGTCTMVPTPVQ